MTKSQMLAKFKKAVKEDDKETLMVMLDPLLESLSNSIQQGVLIKNIKARISNSGITGKCCEMVAEMAVIRAEKFMFYKAR